MPTRTAAAICIAACLAICGYWSIRFAFADLAYRDGRPERVENAIHYNPLQAKYFSWLGEMHELLGKDPLPAWRHAVELNPLDAGSWIRVGLRLEQRGDTTAAEEALLKAASIDRQFEPKATLANFYFRRQREPEFWNWIHQAVSMDYSDARPLFALCWQMSQDPALIRKQCVPDDPAAYRKYLGYLTAQGNVDAAIPVFGKLAPALKQDDVEMLLGFCDVLLAAHRAGEARAVWNQMAAQHLFAYPASSATLVNGDFQVDPRRMVQRAFAWRLSKAEGVDYSLLDSPRALEIALDGQEQESLELLGQSFVADPGKRYKLEYTYKTTDIKAGSGLRFRVVAGTSTESGALMAPEWKTETIEFPASLNPAAYLALVYDRTSGTTRIRGSIDLRELRIEEIP